MTTRYMRGRMASTLCWRLLVAAGAGGLLCAATGCKTAEETTAAITQPEAQPIQAASRTVATMKETYDQLGKAKMEIDRVVGTLDLLTATNRDLATNFKV